MSTTLRDQLYQMLSGAAANGRPAPGAGTIAQLLGIARHRVSPLMAEAEAAGLIRLYGRGQAFRVEVVATGQTTATRKQVTSKPRGERLKPVVFRAEELPQDVGEARLWLQRRGYPVYRAHVIGGGKDRWIIGGPGKEYTDAQLVNFARSRGWQQSERGTA